MKKNMKKFYLFIYQKQQANQSLVLSMKINGLEKHQENMTLIFR